MKSTYDKIQKRLFVIYLLSILIIGCESIKYLGEQTIEIGFNYAEYSIPYIPKTNENPFDIIAKSTFTHEDGKLSREALWFFAKDSIHLRFSALEAGTWSFTTSSDNKAINGFSGKVNIKTSEEATKNGYLIGNGKKWFWQTSKKAIVPQLVMGRRLSEYINKNKQEDDLNEFLENHRFNGLHIPSISMGWFELKHAMGSYENISRSPNPSPVAFETLEALIEKTYRKGGILHFWMWGDESRKQTPVKWSINGKVDLRLQRYLAARLGALPGWSASYGFDLPEWVTPEQLQQWHDTLQNYLVVPHLLSGRSKKHQMTPYAEGLGYESYEHHRPDYQKYLTIYQNSKGKPVFSEDRFRIRNRTVFAPKDYSEELTFQGMWQSTMAGGVANIWGNLALQDSEKNSEYSLPYRNKEAIKTYHTFFFDKDRFSLQFEPIPNAGELLLAEVPDRKLLIAYQSDTDEVSLASVVKSEQNSVIAVNTLKPYAEILLTISEDGVVKLPQVADWAFMIKQP